MTDVNVNKIRHVLSQSSILNTHIFVLENDEDQRSAYCVISFLSSKSGDIMPAVR